MRRSVYTSGMVALLALLAAAVHAEAPSFGDVQGLLLKARSQAATMAAPPAPKTEANPWARAKTPTRSKAEAIGSYSAGCLRGAQTLEASGPGFEVMRRSRERFYGHPELLDYLRGVGARAQAAGQGTVFIGNLGMARGGPTPNGHVSHQSGLDVDVWTRVGAPGERPSDEQRESWGSPSMVVPDFERVNAQWDPRVVDLLKNAASDARVDRIFINPVIKREACRREPGAAWLQKLRPYYLHDDHLHVRLKCPPSDKHCQAQEPSPSGDGCGAELSSWFTPERKAENRKMRTEPASPRGLPRLPALCAQVLNEP